MDEHRLIDANEYLQKVCTYKETGCGSCKFQECCPKDQPTAYDIDNVVKKLINHAQECTDRATHETHSFVLLFDAIKIVKGGKTDEQTA